VEGERAYDEIKNKIIIKHAQAPFFSPCSTISLFVLSSVAFLMNDVRSLGSLGRGGKLACTLASWSSAELEAERTVWERFVDEREARRRGKGPGEGGVLVVVVVVVSST